MDGSERCHHTCNASGGWLFTICATAAPSTHPCCWIQSTAAKSTTQSAPACPPLYRTLRAGNTKGSEGYGEITQGSLQRLCCLLGDLRATILSKLCEAPWPRAWDLRSDSCVHGTPPSKPGARGSANDGLTPG